MKRWENRSGLLSECEQMDNMENMSGTSGYKRLKMILERRKQGCFKHVEWISSNLKNEKIFSLVAVLNVVF